MAMCMNWVYVWREMKGSQYLDTDFVVLFFSKYSSNSEFI